jgi:hypothetical protein
MTRTRGLQANELGPCLVKCCGRRHSTQDNERRNDRVVPAERWTCECSQGQLRKRVNTARLRATGLSLDGPRKEASLWTRSAREELGRVCLRSPQSSKRKLPLHLACLDEGRHVQMPFPPIACGRPREHRLLRLFLHGAADCRSTVPNRLLAS